MTRFASAFAALAAAATLAACGPRYQTVTFDLRSQPPVPVRLTGEDIEIPAGIAVSVHVTIESSARIEFTNKDALALKSQDRDILLSEATPGPTTSCSSAWPLARRAWPSRSSTRKRSASRSASSRPSESGMG
ncbi:hypothetical protein [Nannocystis pusilla]|uniref:hypothetical protein n=1 Tax=Nannocystis pusilla TaxID=889268 RepID=UPI003B7B5A26